jgi:hypothetical protein
VKVPGEKVKELLLLGVKARVENSYISRRLREEFKEDLMNMTYKSYYLIQKDLEIKMKENRKKR